MQMLCMRHRITTEGSTNKGAKELKHNSKNPQQQWPRGQFTVWHQQQIQPADATKPASEISNNANQNDVVEHYLRLVLNQKLDNQTTGLNIAGNLQKLLDQSINWKLKSRLYTTHIQSAGGNHRSVIIGARQPITARWRHSKPVVTTPTIALDFSGTTQQSASHNVAPNQGTTELTTRNQQLSRSSPRSFCSFKWLAIERKVHREPSATEITQIFDGERRKSREE
ncbi:inositol-1,4,5-triphosphate-5-phosphatase [Dorcoceras hygrometricum]|uniref:Inositol-1,4,5-triphosphate-5-phosphatase n=1 Tax=Dorcoceras hygrometricum TaxID=472368 RepID=A0A2Z7BDJ4_9LAMI|nr:inositol-1,4,5-triphosphate-5-phosphatase [Dorcoceras hygrometricum]